MRSDLDTKIVLCCDRALREAPLDAAVSNGNCPTDPMMIRSMLVQFRSAACNQSLYLNVLKRTIDGVEWPGQGSARSSSLSMRQVFYEKMRVEPWDAGGCGLDLQSDDRRRRESRVERRSRRKSRATRLRIMHTFGRASGHVRSRPSCGSITHLPQGPIDTPSAHAKLVRCLGAATREG